jgi:paraquat-inducible protein B
MERVIRPILTVGRGRAKDSSRDYAVGNGDGGRGMPMGGSCKDLAIIAQTKRKLCQTQHATRIVQLSSALKSMNDRLKSTIEAVRTMNDIGMKDKAKEMAEQIPDLMVEIKELEDEIMNLKEEKSQVDTETPVDLYIERGSEAMGVKRTKSKVSSTTTTTNKANTGDSDSDDDAN